MIKMMLCLALWCAEQVAVAEPETSDPLDGLVIKGKLKATNAWLRVGVRGTIEFSEGMLNWSTGKPDEQLQSVPYQLALTDVCLLLTAEGPAEPGSDDEIHWQGCFDGGKLTGITARWTRVEKDFIHDLMLPEVVYFSFSPEQKDQP
jgi:hypothetical protein